MNENATTAVQNVEIFNLAIHQDAVFGEIRTGVVG